MPSRLPPLAAVVGLGAIIAAGGPVAALGVSPLARGHLQEGAGTTSARAEQADQTPAPTFTVRSHVVLLHVNVLDGDGRGVEDLDVSNFQVYEDGQPQTIDFFELRDAPLAAGLVIDSSSSMLTRQRLVHAGVDAFAALSQPRDELFTIVFNEHVRFGLPPGLAFTRSRAVLQASLARGGRGGKTALHDAVIEGLAHLGTASNPKRVLVVLSDGRDNASRHSERNMLYRAGQSSALIHTIWSGELAGERGNPGLLRRLARVTGGMAYQPSDAADLVGVFDTIARSIRRGYTIGYTPTNAEADGSYRRVDVRVRVPGRRYRVVVREGYTAPDDHADAP